MVLASNVHYPTMDNFEENSRRRRRSKSSRIYTARSTATLYCGNAYLLQRLRCCSWRGRLYHK
jgi:hypothetical protein